MTIDREQSALVPDDDDKLPPVVFVPGLRGDDTCSTDLPPVRVLVLDVNLDDASVTFMEDDDDSPAAIAARIIATERAAADVVRVYFDDDDHMEGGDDGTEAPPTGGS